jgi:hypothetical protein
VTAATAYRVKFAAALTDSGFDEFPLAGVTLETRLGAAGALTGQIPIARGDTTTGARIAAIQASGASAVYVYRGGVPWWAGLLWSKTPATDGDGKPSVAIGAATFESYLDRVQLATDLAAMTGADQLTIARSLIDHMQADPAADMGIAYDATVVSGVTRDRVPYQAASRPSYLKMLSDLASLDGGFEFTIQVLTDPTTAARTRMLRMGYPTLNTGVTHRISSPGAILSYSWPEDGSRAATSLMATGSSVNSTVHTNAAALAAGYPRLDATTSYGSITDTSVLETHATADLALAAPPLVVPAVRVRLDATDLTPQSLGDSIRLSITDELFPSGITATYRLVGMTISPPERGRPETCDLILN